MRDYNPTNFAQIENALSEITDIKNETNHAARKEYIRAQLEEDEGFYRQLMRFVRNSDNQFQNLAHSNLQLIREVEQLFKKRKDDPLVVFQLEQLIGHASNLFENKDTITEQNFNDLVKLNQYLTGHGSDAIQKISIFLIVLGLVVLVCSLILLAPTIPGGAIGFFIGLSVVISGIAALWASRQKNVAKAANQLITSIDEIHDVLTYFNEFISPMLTQEYNEYLREGLKTQLNFGFPAKMLKGALILAKQSYETSEQSHDHFLKLIIDICYFSHADAQKLNEIDEVEFCILSTKENNKVNKITLYPSLLLWKVIPHTNPALNYFDNIIAKRLDDEDSKQLKTGLQKVINRGVSSENLKLALEWVVMRNQVKAPEENDDDFYQRIAMICGEEDVEEYRAKLD